MSAPPDARECLCRLERLSRLQARAVKNEKMLSLERILRSRQKVLALLETALLARRSACQKAGGRQGASAEDINLRQALSHLMEEDEKNIRLAVDKLEEICVELKMLKNRGKLLETYGC
jgi:phenylalanyl-tRNA synthetase alpha subunit